jgi:ABC-2 type transport system ATP-binding protein
MSEAGDIETVAGRRNGHRSDSERVGRPAYGGDNAVVEVAGLRKTYRGGVEAVKGIDFEVARGEVFGLLGPNGAGKSTTIGMLTTTISPSGGSAKLAGHDVAKEPLLARSVSSVVFQEAVVDRGLTGRANLELHARLWGVSSSFAARRISELAETLRLSDLINRQVGSYSGGERRRLEIARALVSQPQVLFLDEPTVGLDPLIRHELLDVIAELRAHEEMTILLTTHYLDEAQRLCDRVAIIHLGKIVALDTPTSLLADLGGQLFELRVNGDGAAALASLRKRGVVGKDAFAVGSTLTLPLHDRSGAEMLAALDEAGVGTAGISTRTPTLDDVYLRLTGARIGEAP